MKALLKKIYYFLISLSILGSPQIYAQLSPPQVEDVFGGRILAITGYLTAPNTTRIFISTESANSIFYADVSTTSPVSFSMFQAMPGVDANAGYGDSISLLAVNHLSGSVFFGHETGLLASNPSSTIVKTIFSGRINGLLIADNYLFFIESGKLHFGTLDASDNFTEDSTSPLTLLGIGGKNSLAIDPVTKHLFVFSENPTLPTILEIHAAYTSLTGASVVTGLYTGALSGSTLWTAFNIAPDDAYYFIGHDGQDQYCAKSIDAGATWSIDYIGPYGTTGDNISFSGDAVHYSIFTSNVFNDNNGSPSDWHQFGESGFETHPNGGAAFADPANKSMVYMTTDQGLGASTDGGYTIFEIDDGIEAVQVMDFSMTPSKSTAWTASKSGIRHVSNYQTSPSWTNAIFPNRDGSPYYSVEMSHADSNTVYAGNVRIYKTTDNGTSWNQIFTPENAPYNFPSIGTHANAIEECSWNPNIVMAGFEIEDTLNRGGLFVSTDAGNTWEQILLVQSSIGEDVDVTDIAFNIEGTDTVAYVTVKYEHPAPSGYSVYKVVKSGTTWTASEDMSASNTSTGTIIVTSLYDVLVSTTGDSIFVAGTEAGSNHPVVYLKDLSGSGLWTPFTGVGFPVGTNEICRAVTLGPDTLFAAVDNEVYYYDLTSGTSWQLGYTYPVGTRINFLYYDELLVGTSVGLFAHGGKATSVQKNSEEIPEHFSLLQNYPNPFNPTTKISFAIPQSGFVTLKIYNAIGREIATLVNKQMPAGNYEVTFNASNLASGIYFYRLQSGNFTATKKMILLK